MNDKEYSYDACAASLIHWIRRTDIVQGLLIVVVIVLLVIVGFLFADLKRVSREVKDLKELSEKNK
jgi:hypothetical protein